VPTSNYIYRRLVNITHTYLGPAAERFIDRQIRSHLCKDPKDLTQKDLKKLIDWIRTAVSLLTSDQKLVEEYIAQVEELSKEPAKK
jgi:hypothetical protein